MRINYVATLTAGTWHEEGWMERGGQRLARVFEMTLHRVGDTHWPADTAVGAR